MPKEAPAGEAVSSRAIVMGVAAVSLVICVAVAMIAIINDKMPLAAVCSVLAVGSHLLLWYQINRGHQEKEAAADQNR